jgi:type II secretory pathway component GspD/PulD (secretin)
MRMLALAAITVLAVHAAHAQQLEPPKRGPLTIHFVNTSFEDVIGFVAKYAGILVEMDESATRERRNTMITVRLKGVTVEEALDHLTRLAGLSYMVVDAQTIRIYQAP